MFFDAISFKTTKTIKTAQEWTKHLFLRGSPAGTAGLNPITLLSTPSPFFFPLQPLSFCFLRPWTLVNSIFLRRFAFPPTFYDSTTRQLAMADLQGRKVFKVFNQDFIVSEQYNVTKELGQGAYGIVW